MVHVVFTFFQTFPLGRPDSLEAIHHGSKYLPLQDDMLIGLFDSSFGMRIAALPILNILELLAYAGTGLRREDDNRGRTSG